VGYVVNAKKIYENEAPALELLKLIIISISLFIEVSNIQQHLLNLLCQ
jgi:hypothetical protein